MDPFLSVRNGKIGSPVRHITFESHSQIRIGFPIRRMALAPHATMARRRPLAVYGETARVITMWQPSFSQLLTGKSRDPDLSFKTKALDML